MIRDNRFLKIIPWLLLLFSFAYAIYFVNYNYIVLMNGDTSPEMQLGKILAEEGGILSRHWSYVTEPRVLNTQIVYKLFFMIFKNDWKIVRLLSDVVLLIIYVLSYLFMMKHMGLTEAGKWTAWMLPLPFGSNYGYLITYAGFYIPHVAITFFSLGLIFAIYRSDNKKHSIALGVLLGLLTFGAGLGGARQALICYIPLIISSLVSVFIRYYTKKEFKPGLLILSICSFITFMVGMVINTSIMPRFYSYNAQSGFKWKGISLAHLADVLGDFLSVYGFCFKNVSFMGVYGAVNFLALGFVAIWIVSMIALLRNHDRLGLEQLVYVLLAVIAIGFNAFVYASVGSSYFLYHWVSVMPYVYPFIPMAAVVLKDKLDKSIPIFFLYILGTFLLVSHITLKNPIEPRINFYTDGREFETAVEPLMQLKSTEGFGLRWNSSVLVEMTNGAKDIWVSTDPTLTHLDDTAYVDPGLQDIDHTKELPQGSFFVVTYRRLFDVPDYPANTPLFYDEEHLKYSDDKVTIYEFENMDDYRETIDSLREQGYVE